MRDFGLGMYAFPLMIVVAVGVLVLRDLVRRGRMRREADRSKERQAPSKQ